MKYLMCLFYVFIAVAYFGSTLGDKEDSEDVDCPLKHVTGRRSPLKILEELVRIEAGCLNETIDLDLGSLERLKGIDEHREFFRDLCRGRTATRHCLDAKYPRWTGCYNETMGDVFKIFADFVDSTLDKGCVDEGEGLAAITDGYHRFSEDYRARNPFVRECVIYSTVRWMTVLVSPANIATKIWFLYGGLRYFQNCFAEHVSEESLLRISVLRMEEVLEEMKCIHPVDGSLVLCKSIDSSLIDRASACPLRTRGEVVSPISVSLERRLFSCFLVYEPYGQKLSDATSLEQFGGYFENYCRRNARVRHCLNETMIAAEVCLHDPQFENFKLGGEFLHDALETGCSERGRRLASFFHTAKRLENNTEVRAGLSSCLSAAEVTKTLSVDDATRFQRLYRELPAARRCFVDKMAEDTDYVDDVTGFIDELMAKMKCVDVRHGTVVQCHTLETTDPDSLS